MAWSMKTPTTKVEDLNPRGSLGSHVAEDSWILKMVLWPPQTHRGIPSFPHTNKYKCGHCLYVMPGHKRINRFDYGFQTSSLSPPRSPHSILFSSSVSTSLCISSISRTILVFCFPMSLYWAFSSVCNFYIAVTQIPNWNSLERKVWFGRHADWPGLLG